MTNQEIYQFIKDIKEKKNEYQNFIIPILNEKKSSIGYLKPITMDILHEEEKPLISLLTKWRKMFMKFFLTQFTPSTERTEKWLRETVLPCKDRILFLIYTVDDKVIGNLGVCNINAKSAELDNLIRGEKGGDTQLIYYAEVSLLRWLFLDLNIDNSYLHVFSNNNKTIDLHKKVGFEITKEHNLWKQKIDNEIKFSITQDQGYLVDFSYLEMNLSRENFIFEYC